MHAAFRLGPGSRFGEPRSSAGSFVFVATREHGLPIGALGLDSELHDQQTSDRGEGDVIGRQMHVAERDRFVTGSEVKRSHSPRQVEMCEIGLGDFGMPVVGQYLAPIPVQHVVCVANRPRSPALIRADIDLVDEVKVADEEVDSPSAIRPT